MSREVGDEFEKKIANLLDLSITANSGAIHDDGDLYDYKGPLRHFVIELKRKSVPFFRSNKGEITKLIKQADKLGKDWIYIQGTDDGDYALMSVDALATLVDELNELRSKNKDC